MPDIPMMENVTVTTVVVSCALVGLTYFIYKTYLQLFLSPLRKIPSMPHNNPITGNLNFLTTGEAMEATIKMHQMHGRVVRYFFLLNQERLSITEPKIFKHILVSNCKNYKKPESRLRMMKVLLGNGLVTSEAPVHTVHKRLIAPSFTQQSVTKLIPLFEKYIKTLVVYWRKHVPQEGTAELAIEDDIKRCTLDIIGEAGFGYVFDSIENSQHKVSTAFQHILTGAGLTWRTAIPFYFLIPTAENKTFFGDLKTMNGVVYDIINKKRDMINKHQDMDSVTKDVLGMMMVARDDETGQGLSDTELRDHVMTLLLAGHETTAVAVSWCLLTLARHPEIQDRARAEIRSVIHDDQPITIQQLDKLEYCSWIIKETLRLYPPVPLTLRQSLKEDTLPGGYYIPAQTIILLAIGPAMRDPELFDDPDTFNPDRFSNKEIESAMYNFMPFLIGPRMCIGYRLALLEFRMMLTLFLQHFQFTTVPGTSYKRKSTITMRPHPSLHLLASRVRE